MSVKIDLPVSLMPMRCVICDQPIDLQDCKTDHNGKAAHEEWLVTRTLGLPLHEE
jgi:hypothetical protein